jgi:hypothetical protein
MPSPSAAPKTLSIAHFALTFRTFDAKVIIAPSLVPKEAPDPTRAAELKQPFAPACSYAALR